MNIYKARELQKDLFKHSACEYKKMRIVSACNDDSKIAYVVIHHMSDDKNMDIHTDFIKRAEQDIERDVHMLIDYLSMSEKSDKKLFDPPGFYIEELIEID